MSDPPLSAIERLCDTFAQFDLACSRAAEAMDIFVCEWLLAAGDAGDDETA